MAKKILKGTVVSNKMVKTLVVKVARITKHPKYKKRFLVSKRYQVHYDNGEYQVGDKVTIEEVRPISKHKKWRVTDINREIESSKEEVNIEQ